MSKTVHLLKKSVKAARKRSFTFTVFGSPDFQKSPHIAGDKTFRISCPHTGCWSRGHSSTSGGRNGPTFILSKNAISPELSAFWLRAKMKRVTCEDFFLHRDAKLCRSVLPRLRNGRTTWLLVRRSAGKILNSSFYSFRAFIPRKACICSSRHWQSSNLLN